MDTRQRTLQLAEAISAAIGTLGPGLPLSADTDTRTLQTLERLARYLGVLEPLPSDMTTVTTSIGSGGRDYSTITAWEADLDNGAIYASGDDAVGEVYNDSTFAEGVTINGGGTIGLASRRLTAASADRHDGTRETGARMSVTNLAQYIDIGISNTVVEWLEFDGNDVATNDIGLEIANSVAGTFRNLLVYDVDDNGNVAAMRLGNASSHIVNTTVHTCSGNGIRQFVGTGVVSYLRNLTVYGCGGIGINMDPDRTENYVQNCISVGNSTADFAPSSPSSATMDHNIASDTSASGTGSVDSVSASSLFVSTTAGSEDLHLVSGATDAIDAGTDFGTTPAGVNVDIDGRDRDAEGDTWDIGADEYVAAGGGATIAALAHHHRMMLSA